MIYGWCTVNFFYPSMLALILIGFTPYTTPDQAVGLLFSNAQVLQCIFLMMATAILNVSGVTNYLANWIINRRIVKNRPWLLIIMLMLATTVIGLVANIAGVVFIMWPLVHQIFKKMGYEKGGAAPAFILVGVVLIGNGANLLMPFQIPVVATFGFLFSASNGAYSSFNGMSYLALSIVVFLLTSILYFVIIRFAARIDVSKLRNYEPGPRKRPQDERRGAAGVHLGDCPVPPVAGSLRFPGVHRPGQLFQNLRDRRPVHARDRHRLCGHVQKRKIVRPVSAAGRRHRLGHDLHVRYRHRPVWSFE